MQKVECQVFIQLMAAMRKCVNAKVFRSSRSETSRLFTQLNSTLFYTFLLVIFDNSRDENKQV